MKYLFLLLIVLVAILIFNPPIANAQTCGGGGYVTRGDEWCDYNPYTGTAYVGGSRYQEWQQCTWRLTGRCASRSDSYGTFCSVNALGNCNCSSVNMAGSEIYYTSRFCYVSGPTPTQPPPPPPATSTPTPTPRLPDFDITELRVTDVNENTPSYFMTGDSIYTRVVLANEGVGNPQRATRVAMYKNEPNAASVGDESDVVQYIDVGTSFPPGSSQVFESVPNGNREAQFSGNRRFAQTNTGTYTFRAFADYENVQAEYNGDAAYNQATVTYRVYGTLDGYAFNDLNGNHVRDAGEPGLLGASVNVQRNDGSGNYVNVGTYTTNSSGYFRASDRPFGEYRLQVTAVPAGYRVTGSNPKSTTMGPDKRINFSFIPLGTPTPVPAANLVVEAFELRDRYGNTRTTFTTTERIYPYVIFSNIGDAAATVTSADGYTHSRIYKNKPSQVAQGEETDANIRINNGQFGAGYSDEYYCTPAPGNKCNNTIFPAAASFTMPTPGDYTARVFLNFDRSATEPNIVYPPSVGNGNRDYVNYTIIPDTTYTISGNVYFDLNTNGSKDAGENNYTGGGTAYFTNSSGVSVNAPVTNGVYTSPLLRQGTYTVDFSGVTGYITTPTQGRYIVTIGPGGICTPVGGSICDVNGSLTNLNFGLQQSAPWIQTKGLDMRLDNGISNIIPAGSSCTQFTSLDGVSGNPGVIITGDNAPTFTGNIASSENWVVGEAGNLAIPYASTGELRTSYDSLKTTISGAKQSTQPLSTIAQCTDYNNCQLLPLTGGVYTVGTDLIQANLTINTGNITGDKKVVILVNGKVSINGPINVDPGSFLLITASEDINVLSNVGNSTPGCSEAPVLEGIFVSDKSFNVLGNGSSCNIDDLMLTMEGSVIVNAARGSGSFNNFRTLCTENTRFPAVKINDRPDFFLNAPGYIQAKSTSWREVAP